MADIGSTLREARMRGRISIDEVETRTKIRARYLRAIENEEWDLLPGPVYVKSFLRTYGDYLGLDSRLLIDEYKRRYERPTDHDVRPIAPHKRERERERGRRGPRFPRWASIVLVLAAVVVALYLLGTLNTANKTPTTAGTHTTSSHSTSARGKSHRPRHRAARPAAHKPATVKLQLVATAAVYICLVDGRGVKLIPGEIFSPGQTIPTETAGKLLLTLGNNSVVMKVNGVPVRVAPSSSAIGFLLEPTGNTPLAPSQQPTCA
ncbi:MAG: helix-turn-helix domain-containing protein [Solirubrobacteraceae bacterium]|jgi:cytoskeletal protein RodZ